MACPLSEPSWIVSHNDIWSEISPLSPIFSPSITTGEEALNLYIFPSILFCSAWSDTVFGYISIVVFAMKHMKFGEITWFPLSAKSCSP